MTRPPRMPLGFLRPRSLTFKLALLVFMTTALSVAVIFLYVVPQLTTNLENQTLDNLEQVALATSDPLSSQRPGKKLDELVRGVADRADARITLFGIEYPERDRAADRYAVYGVNLYPQSDSRVDERLDESFGVAARAVRSGEVERGVGSAAGDPVAQVARPFVEPGERVGQVVLYSRSLSETHEAVDLIRNEMLVGIGAALVVALLGAYAVGVALARRVRRLEGAARQVAAGHVVAPLPIDSEDELGKLTAAFNEMQVQLAQVERARREFVATASHELRTPIFSLGGFVELLQDEELEPAEREEFLQMMGEQVERLKKLAVDLLDLSRLDAGSIHLRPEPTDLRELARTAANEFAPRALSHGTEVELCLPDVGVEAHCDPDRVTQIVRILLDNALRHTPEGTSVAVSARRENGSAELTVTDGGPGVAAMDDARIFERFYTGDAARGSGLGLAIGKELAERMGGRIEVRARPGETAFTVVLPVGEPAPSGRGELALRG